MPAVLAAGTLRVAVLHAELTRKGPGLLLRDIAKGDDPQIDAFVQLVGAAAPDILLLTKVDVDAGGVTLRALKDLLGFQFGYSQMPNSAYFADDLRMAYGPFAGAGGMVLLSKVPFLDTDVTSYHELLWKDLDGAQMPLRPDGTQYYSAAQSDALRLVTQGLWVVPIEGTTVVVFQNTAPVFDGAEDRNGLRSRDQLRLIEHVVDGLQQPFVVMGNTNLDPEAGDGDSMAMAAFLAREDLVDPKPVSERGGLNTAIWESPGPMRVSYVLPSRDVQILGAGVVWPSEGPLREIAERASRHRLVWVDITR